MDREMNPQGNSKDLEVTEQITQIMENGSSLDIFLMNYIFFSTQGLYVYCLGRKKQFSPTPQDTNANLQISYFHKYLNKLQHLKKLNVKTHKFWRNFKLRTRKKNSSNMSVQYKEKESLRLRVLFSKENVMFYQQSHSLFIHREQRQNGSRLHILSPQ